MQLVIHKLILVLVILAGCSPILKPIEKQSQNPCSEEITGSFLQAKMYQQYIVLEQENSNFIVYDLTQQTTNCDIEKSDNLLFLFGPKEAKKMANGLRLAAASDPQMTIKSFSKKKNCSAHGPRRQPSGGVGSGLGSPVVRGSTSCHGSVKR